MSAVISVYSGLFRHLDMQCLHLISVYSSVFRYLDMQHPHSSVFRLHSGVFQCISVFIRTHNRVSALALHSKHSILGKNGHRGLLGCSACAMIHAMIQ